MGAALCVAAILSACPSGTVELTDAAPPVAPDAAAPLDASVADADAPDAPAPDADAPDAEETDSGPPPDAGFRLVSGTLAPAAGSAETVEHRLQGSLQSSSPRAATSATYKLRGGFVPQSP